MSEVLTMKKNYMAPEAEFLKIATSDISCASGDPVDPMNPNDPAGYGSEIYL